VADDGHRSQALYRGHGIWQWAGNDQGVRCCHCLVPTLKTLAAVSIMRRHLRCTGCLIRERWTRFCNDGREWKFRPPSGEAGQEWGRGFMGSRRSRGSKHRPFGDDEALDEILNSRGLLSGRRSFLAPRKAASNERALPPGDRR
jgi:hypothetical protein